MSFLPIQSVTNTGTGGTVVLTTSSTVLNNLVVVGILIVNATESCTSVTDDKSNTYVLSSAFDANGGNRRVYQAYGVQVNSGATVITANFSGNVVAKRAIGDEFSGGQITNASIFDSSKTGSGASTDRNLSVSTLTPSSTGELIVAIYSVNNTVNYTAGTDYTLSLSHANPTSTRTEYRLSSIATETAPISIDADPNNWAGMATAFKAYSSFDIASTMLQVF